MSHENPWGSIPERIREAAREAWRPIRPSVKDKIAARRAVEQAKKDVRESRRRG